MSNTSEDKIISYCQVISHWASMRGQSMVWQKKDEFAKYDRYLKKWIGELIHYVMFGGETKGPIEKR